ncbi:MAG TPA: hypothetical protein VHA74_01535, partial [Candidatus Dojkabacteria bacterium]|nr:hypothetical protein [Candidatus Dojkabacteria bacterium]
MKNGTLKLFTILLLSIGLTLGFLNTPKVYAQTQGTDTTSTAETTSGGITDTSKLFEVELQIGTQSAWTKSIPIYIKFRSTVDADNVQISWDVPAGLKYTMNHPQFVSVKKDQVYTYKMTVQPQTAGDYNIGGNVTLWQFNTNYTSAGSVEVKIGEDLLTQPLTSGYTGAVILKYIIIFLLIVLGGIGTYFGGKKVLEILK